MGRKSLIECSIDFDKKEKLGNKILEMFSSENLINCFSSKNYEKYKKVISEDAIQNILNDSSLIDTINKFYDNNLNMGIASEKTYMHRNTLNYRLEKIHKLIGLNLKLFDHAMVFKNLLIVNEIIKAFEE